MMARYIHEETYKTFPNLEYRGRDTLIKCASRDAHNKKELTESD